MEPEFTRAISSRFVCNYLYSYMWFAVVVAALAVLGGIGTAVAMKGSVITRILMTLPNIFVAAIAVLTALSLYIICERGLRPEEASNKGGRSAEGYINRH